LSFLRSKRGMGIIAAVVVLGLFLVRPGAEQLRTRIVRAISLSLGRPVDVSSVSIQLLPRPGFDLQNFVVHEDPAFGAEPTLRASQVTAALRVTSLLRGRLEIARLSLNDPSVNLVRDAGGRWNLENLLERADQTHVAPTSKSKSEERPGFPYIEANSARVNFKFGQEKKPYTLTDSDFSVWQDSEDTWGMRFKGRPVRTDFNLSDTGTVRIQGSWQRAATLRDTPVRFDLQWDHSQLGQATTLFYGHDQGWRGTVTVSAAITGTPTNLAIQSSGSVDDFRRYDLDGGGSLRLAAECSASYAPLDNKVFELSCHTPVSGGFVALKGEIGGLGNANTYDLNFSAKDVPMQAVVVLARHTKKNIPDDLTAAGTLEGAFELRQEQAMHGAAVTWSGGGQTRNLSISSAATGISLSLDKVPLLVSTGTGDNLHGAPRRPQLVWTHIVSEPHVEVGPLKLGLGKPGPVTIHGWSSRSEYALSIQGDASIQRLLQLARSIGLPTAQPNADGSAKVDLQVAGTWSAFSPALTLGTAQLRSVHAQVRGVGQPLEIASADVMLLPGKVQVQDVTASLGKSTWRGSFMLPRQCGVPALCLVQFNLNADAIDTDEWSELLGSHTGRGPWYRMFAANASSGNSYLLALHATGELTADRVLVHKLAATGVSAHVDLQNGILRLSTLQGEVLGGKHTGEWTADFTAKPPEYSGSGTFEAVELGQLSQATHDGWITGSGTASYTSSASGLTAGELMASADATLQITALEGTLPHIVLDNEEGPLRVRGFTGKVLLQKGQFEIAEGRLESANGVYQLSGTSSLTGELDLRLLRANSSGFTIVGPFTAPNVTQAATDAQAALKQ